MQPRIIIFLVAAAILLTVLVPAVVFIAAVLLLITPALLVARRPIDELSAAQPLALRTLPLFRAPPGARPGDVVRRLPCPMCESVVICR